VDGSRSLWRRQAGCGSRPKHLRSSGSVTMVLVSELFPPEPFVFTKLLYVLKPLKINSYASLRTVSKRRGPFGKICEDGL
jgi:hypothetical protein